MTWQDRFDRLLKAMSEGEPHKAEKRASAVPTPSEDECHEARPQDTRDWQSEEK
jgi:hypothetical protein